MDHALIFPATDDSIARAAAWLAAGHLVGLPTETVYGLAANAWDATAVAKIYEAKRRPPSNPLIVHVANVDRLADAIRWPPRASVRAQLDQVIDLWPGPLTIVCERSDAIPDIVTAGQANVAVRIPAHDVARALLDACDFPIAAPSANRSQYISPTRAEHLFGPAGISDHVAMVIDGGPCHWGVESTIVKLGDDGPRLLRPGAISAQELSKRFGVTTQSLIDRETHHDPLLGNTDNSDAEPLLEAPGMMREHYSPTTPLMLIDASTAQSTNPWTGSAKIGRIAFHRLSESETGRYRIVECLSEHGDLNQVAFGLFAALRRLDDAGLDAIHCDTCAPQGIGDAIMDRLTRAAAKQA